MSSTTLKNDDEKKKKKQKDESKNEEEKGGTIIPSSVRADGSVRKPIRIRAGYVNQFEVKKYVSPALRQEEVKEEEEKEEGFIECEE